MRDPNRIDEILNIIEAIWRKYPDLRLTQLISNCFSYDTNLYYVEDDELIEGLKNLYKIKE